jgi:hypothetical protein
MPFHDIAAFGAVLVAIAFGLAIHRAVSNYFRKKSHGEE